MDRFEKLAGFPRVVEFVEALEDEAESRVSPSGLELAMSLFNMGYLTDAIVRSRVVTVEGFEGVAYDYVVEGGSADLDLYYKVVFPNPDFVYMDKFASVLWDN